MRIAKQEERRLSALEELTYEEEANMEIEAIALQGHLLKEAERRGGKPTKRDGVRGECGIQNQREK